MSKTYIKIMSKTYIDNATFMEYISELATQITKMNYGEDTWIEDEHGMSLSDEAQDYYNEMYDEFEALTNNLLGVYSNIELDNLKDIAKKYREIKLNK